MSLSGTMRDQISADEKNQLLTVAHEMAVAAKEAILPYFRVSDLALENKDAADFDPVTAADKAAEQAMRDVLALKRPQDGIWGEEFGRSSGVS
ncbi:MAG: hypothetical protein HOH05_12975, partial [Marinovum sp.]|nr:hypothetical protein [Marinovum sp.]